MSRHLTLIGATGVALFVLAAALLLLTIGRGANADERRDQLDIVKIALTVVAGTGGLVALVVAYRRQQVLEEAHLHTQAVDAEKAHDALERRITETYRHAVEQLGSDRAAVRLGGMYALERLAQHHPTHRQITIDVLCAYLRMACQAADESITATAAPAAAVVVGTGSADPTMPIRVAGEEREVRLTAQRILTRHLPEPVRGGTATDLDLAWVDMDLDLTGAVLVDFDLGRSRLRTARFDHATFVGDVNPPGMSGDSISVRRSSHVTPIAVPAGVM